MADAEEKDINRGYMGVCVAVLERAFKDYVSEKPIDRKDSDCNRSHITMFMRSKLCEFYCMVADVEVEYCHYLFNVARDRVKNKR